MSQLKKKRGGYRVDNHSAMKKENLREFIGSLKGTEPYYNRKKLNRIYLSYDLSISKPWNIYNNRASKDMKLGEPMFRRIFNNDFT